MAASQAQLLQLLRQQPGVHFAAAQRLAAARSPLLPRQLALCLRLAGGGQQAGQGASWRGFALQVWAVPDLASQLSAANRAALLQQGVLGQLLASLQLAAQQGQLSGLPAMWALANTVQLLAAAPGAQPLAELAAAEPFCSAAVQLLVAASSGKGAGGSSGSSTVGWTLALNSAGPLADQPMLLQLLAALGQQHMPLFARLCVQLVHTLPEVCKRGGGPSAATSSTAPAAAAAASSSTGAAQEQAPQLSVPSALNALAFSPPVLPQLWRWLAGDLGLPLEAPFEASRGLDVASLAGGVEALAPHHAAALGLFCR